MGELNRLLQAEPALHQLDFDPAGFEWIAADDVENSVYAFVRRGAGRPRTRWSACSTSPPSPASTTTSACPPTARWAEVLNTDAALFGGSNLGNLGGCPGVPVASHGRPASAYLTLPPLSAVFLKRNA